MFTQIVEWATLPMSFILAFLGIVMQSEIFQNFIDSIQSLNNEQWSILDKTLLNARIPVDNSEEKPDSAAVPEHKTTTVVKTHLHYFKKY